jgi:hypothetical protein
MMDEVAETGDVIYSSSLSINELVSLDRKHRRILCPVCRSEVLVVLSRARSIETGLHQGVFCSANQAHVSLFVSVGRPADYWDKFKKMES